MRKFTILAVALLWPFSVFAQDNRFYVGIHGGGLFVEDSDVSNSGASGTIEFDPGFAVGGVFGYKLKQGVRFEGEYTYRRAGADGGCVSGVGCASASGDTIDGHADAHAIMANVFYEPKFGKWLPYVGGGLGIGVVGYEADGTIAGISVEADDSDAVFAYQAGAGIGYELTENHLVSLGYRYWATTDPELDGADAEVGTHSILAELRTTF